MNRNVVAALSIAAVLGTTGGVGAALARGHHPTDAAPPATAGTSQTPAPTPTPTRETNEPLLYATTRAIHDGARVVPLAGPDNVSSVQRIRDGYLVASRVSAQDAAADLWVVSGGNTRRLARVSGGWDLDAGGTRLVADPDSTQKVTVWSLPDGRPRAAWKRSTDAVSSFGFRGADVLITTTHGDPGYVRFRWDPATDQTRGDGIGYEQTGISPGGSYLTGKVDPDGVSSTTAGANTCLHLEATALKRQRVSWDTCDWRGEPGPPAFSPDGTRLLVIPKDSDGFGPGTFSVVDASDGPGRLVGTIDAPDWTLGAQWADNDHLYVFGSLTDDPGPTRKGTFIDRCDLQGSCHRVVTVPGMATVGSGR